jgi:D-glycero-D-manno-heptose 1,7-bisphosphate phosphatase
VPEPWVPSAAFLDRDGTIIVDPGYISRPDKVQLIRGAARAIRLLNVASVPVVVVTNQSGIGRGYYTEDDFRRVQAEMERLLLVEAAVVDAVYFCPHNPEDGPSQDRKPDLGMYRRAARDLGVILENGLYIGDRISDVLPAARTGGRGVLVGAEAGAYDGELPPGCALALDLYAAVTTVLGSDGDPHG